MYIITTLNGVTKRLAIPADVVLAGKVDSYAAKPPATAWAAAAVVGRNWPYDDAPAPSPLPDPIAPVADAAPLSPED